MWLDEDTGDYRPRVEDPFPRGVWLDPETGAYRAEMIRDGEPMGGYASVFDGLRAGTRLDHRGTRSVRYEGRPQVVARLAGSHAVTAAFAFVNNKPLPRGVQVREATNPWPSDRGNPFDLPTGGDCRVVRQVDPITPEAIGRANWLGTDKAGTPLFAATSTTTDGFVTAVIVYQTVCIITSTVPYGDRLLGEAITIGDGTPATAAHARANPDGQFGVRWRGAGGGINRIGYYGPELTYAGAGELGLVVATGDDHIVVTGLGVTTDTAANLAATLRRI
jgi:hypothetical protein